MSLNELSSMNEQLSNDELAEFVGEVDETEVPEQLSSEAEVEDEQLSDTEQAAEQEQEAVVEQTQDAIADLTEKLESENLTKAEIRKIYGKIGELNSKLTNVINANTSPVKLKFDAKNFEELKENFDPEVAEMIVTGLNRSFGVTDNTTNNEEAPQQETATQIEQRLTINFNKQLLAVTHPDYLEIANSVEFDKWKGTLPEHEVTELLNSNDAAYLNSRLTQFKSWHETQANKQASSSERLKDAITPSGNKGGVQKLAMTEDDGFNSVT